MERHFWSEADGLYRDEISADWTIVSPYRGQNANMHSCEAMLAAYEATGDAKYLDRAERLARRVTIDLAGKADGLVWEHYDADWNVDWDYNRDDPKHLFRPWGYQPGHQTEWAKLLLILERHRPAEWLLPTARHLFDTAMHRAWDAELGGIFYGFAPDHSICDGDKYFWVQAESFAAAALLAARTARSATGAGTTGSGTTPGGTWSTTSTAPGSGSSTSATRSTTTRRARPARPTTTPWGPATKLSTS